MRWVAPTERNAANQTLEKRLSELFRTKSEALFEHVYENYFGDGGSVYATAAL